MSLTQWLKPARLRAADMVASRRRGNMRNRIVVRPPTAFPVYHAEALERRLLLAGTPAMLAFAQPVTSVGVGVNLSLSVNVEDANGAVVTSDSSPVTLILNGGLFSNGFNSLNTYTSGGIATFSNYAIPKAGTYTLTATDGTLTAAVSAQFNVYVSNPVFGFSAYPNGANPQSSLAIDSTGNLFGTTYQGGSGGYGTVFEITHNSSTVTTLASFNGGNGANPQAGVTLDASGNLFGTTYAGGTANYGTVFELIHATNTLVTLASFNSTNGSRPVANVTLDSSGNLFGTTSGGGTSNCGTVFEIPAASGTLTTLASFINSNGNSPRGQLIFDSSGNLFGTTVYGGASGYGTVFEVPRGAYAITTVASFTSTNGSAPYGGVTLDSSGNLFGTTYSGGSNNTGTVFEVVHGTSTITKLASFIFTNGSNPQAGLGSMPMATSLARP